MDVSILINNSVSVLSGLPDNLKELLRVELSYTNNSVAYMLKQNTRRISMLEYRLERALKSGHEKEAIASLEHSLKALGKKLAFLKYKQVVYLYSRKTGQFPTGLLNLVQKFLTDNSVPFSQVDMRRKPDKYLFLPSQYNDYPMRYFQKEILDLCLQKSRASVESATGSGKTRIILELVQALGVRTLIVVPTINILSQTYKLLVRKFGAQHVGMVGDSVKQISRDIIVASVQTLINLEPEYFNKFDCLIIDECHHSSSDVYKELNEKCFNGIYYRFFFSGTIFRNDGSGMGLLGVVSTIDYRYPASKGIKDGFLAAPIFFIKQNSLSKDNVVLKGTTYRTHYVKYIVDNKKRNAYIVEAARKLVADGKSVMILVDQVKHGKIIEEMMPECVFIYSLTKKNEKMIDDFNIKKIPILMGTDVIGEGVDTVGADALILAGGGKARSSVIQKVGRVLRLGPNKKYAIVIDFADLNVSTFKNHSLERQEIYEEYETEIIQI